jgi:creatinine amidohydrolase
MQSKSIRLLIAFFISAWSSSAFPRAQETQVPSSREMNLLCWQEFQELVPKSIETVLLPVGSIEPHGVIPNGTDNLAPESMSKEIAERVNALIAPTLNYGVTAAMKGYPGAVSIKEEAYGLFVSDILSSLASHRFMNIIIMNGHGGNSAKLREVAAEISDRFRVRILVVNWWSLTTDDVFDVFGENGGHAGNNETAYIQAVYPRHIHPERYSKDMATPNPPSNAYFAVPVASSIGLYEEGQGYPTFDEAQAKEYYDKVNDRVGALIVDVIRKWEMAKLFR